ncbi:MAG: extracellular solute-binding protein, partial [bacterium]|nr:extracellular solute-binding protein [bacterium]
MSKRTIAKIGILLALTQFAALCGKPAPVSNKPVELVIWKTFDSEENLRPIFDAYKKLHPNVSFRFEKKDIADYENELLTAFAKQAGPDIFSIHNDWVPKYKDYLATAPEGLFSQREFQDTFVDVAKEDLYDPAGNLYAVPMSMDVLALYYNRDLLGSAGISVPPRTWDEVIADVKKLTRQDKLGNFLINGIALGTSSNVNRSVDVLSLLMLQNGTQIFNTERTLVAIDRVLTKPDGSSYNPGAQALEFYTQFANPAKETYTWSVRNNQSIDAFASGQAAMMISYSYITPLIRGKSPLLNFGVAPVPQIDMTKPKVGFANYFAEGVSKVSPNTSVAWDFLRFATKAENLQAYYSMNKLASPRKDLISTQISDPELGVFAEGALTAKTFYKPDASNIEAIFLRMIDDIILRNRTPQQALS